MPILADTMTSSSVVPLKTGRPVVPLGFHHPRICVIESNGRQVIVFDLKGMKIEAEAVKLIDGPFRKFMRCQRPGAGLLTLVETRETPHSAKVATAFREFAKENVPYVHASAVLADRPMHRLAVTTIAMFTKRKIKPFGELDEALEWLTAQ
jgi:hypothetical protein